MIIARLECEMLLLHFTNNDWFVIEKISDVDTPSGIQQIKDGGMVSYINTLKEFKVQSLLSCNEKYSYLNKNYHCTGILLKP
jgi:hypothetical protein